MKELLTAILLGASLFFGSTNVFASPAWTLPQSGLKFENSEKQKYVSELMASLLNSVADSPEIPFEVPDGWFHEKFSLDGLPCEVLENPNATTDRVVLQLHGGGYIVGLNDMYRDFAVKQSVLADAQKIFMVDYRIAPENIFPAANEDAVKIYKEILRRGVNPKKIIVIGDSAGGHLALTLALSLKKNHLPQPAALILLSPLTTFETNLPSIKKNADNDKVLGKINPIMYDMLRKPIYIGKISRKDSRVSPMNANLKGLPPILIQAGSYEVLFDEIEIFAKNAAAAGVEITLTVYPEMSHCFSLLIPQLDESVRSFAEIRDFINRHM